MRLLQSILQLCALTFCMLGSVTHSQELGSIETFGTNGRLYSLDKNEHYLLTRQSYGTEDLTGYQGQIRLVINYEGGGYEIFYPRIYCSLSRGGRKVFRDDVRAGSRREETSSSARIVNPTSCPVQIRRTHTIFSGPHASSSLTNSNDVSE